MSYNLYELYNIVCIKWNMYSRLYTGESTVKKDMTARYIFASLMLGLHFILLFSHFVSNLI